jgi:hypothetical protein
MFQVVIGETLLLLCDTVCLDEGIVDNSAKHMKNVFVDAVDNSDLFARPPYAQLCNAWANTATHELMLQRADLSCVSPLRSLSIDHSDFQR